MPAGPSCAGSSDASSDLQRSSASRAQRHARTFFGLEPVVAPRSPTPTAGGPTPSEPAPHRAPSAVTSTLTTAETSSSRPAPPGFDMGRTRHGAQLAVDQPSTDTGGSIPSRPTTTRASRLTGRAPGSYPGRDWVRGPGRALLRDAERVAAVAQPARAAACRAEGHGFKSRRWRHVDVAEWRRHRSTKPESAGSTPAVEASSP